MWSVRILAFVFFGFIQLLALADTLNKRDEAAAMMVALDTDWVAFFAPLIVYAALCLLFVLSTFFYAAVLALSSSNGAADGGLRYDVGPTADDNATTIAYGAKGSVLQQKQRRKRARILAWDAVFDLLLLVLGAVALGLAVDQLERADDAIVGNERSWASSVLVPIYIGLALVWLLIGLAALRTSGEERYQRPLKNRELLSASLGDVVLCCSVDEQQINEAERQRYDKRPEYAAVANFHSLPCAFICAPALSFGALDVLLGWVLYTLLLAALGVLIGVGLKADGSPFMLHNIFIVLYVLGGATLLFTLATTLTLFCCYGSESGSRKPPNGRSLLAKYGQLLMVLFLTSTGIAQLALLANRVDWPGDTDDWHLVFLPLYIALAVVLFAGCASIACCRSGARRAATVDVRRGGQRLSAFSGASLANYHHTERAPRTSGGASSHWGVFE